MTFMKISKFLFKIFFFPAWFQSINRLTLDWSRSESNKLRLLYYYKFSLSHPIPGWFDQNSCLTFENSQQR